MSERSSSATDVGDNDLGTTISKPPKTVEQVMPQSVHVFASIPGQDPCNAFDNISNSDMPTPVVANGLESYDDKVKQVKAKFKVTHFDMKQGSDDLLYNCPACNSHEESALSTPDTNFDADKQNANDDTSEEPKSSSSSGSDPVSETSSDLLVLPSDLSVPASDMSVLQTDISTLPIGSDSSMLLDDKLDKSIDSDCPSNTLTTELTDVMSRFKATPLNLRQGSNDVVYNCSACQKPFLSLPNMITHLKCHEMCRPASPGSPTPRDVQNIVPNNPKDENFFEDKRNQGIDQESSEPCKNPDQKGNTTSVTCPVGDKSNDTSTDDMKTPSGNSSDVEEIEESDTVQPDGSVKAERCSPATCEICGRKYNSAAARNLHKLVKHGVGRWSTICRKCGERFFDEVAYREHLKGCEDEKEQEQIIESATEADLLTSQKVCEKTSNLLCKVCHQSFSSERELHSHMKEQYDIIVKKGEQITYQCCKCSYTSRKIEGNGILEHRHVVHHKVYLKCSFPNCSRTYSSCWGYRTHLNVVHYVGTYPFECVRCQKRFYTQKDFDVHTARTCPNIENKNTSQGYGDYAKMDMQESGFSIPPSSPSSNDSEKNVCLKCDKQFISYQSLCKHKKIVHELGPWKFTCARCNMRFWNKRDFVSHNQKDHEKLIRCNLCKENFLGEQGIADHIMGVHISIKKQEGKQEASKTKVLETTGEQDPRALKNYIYPERKAKIKARENIWKEENDRKHERMQDKGINKPTSRHRCDKCKKYFVSWLGLYNHQKFKHQKGRVKFIRKHHRRFTTEHCPEDAINPALKNQIEEVKAQNEQSEVIILDDRRETKCRLCGYQFKSDDILSLIRSLEAHMKEKHPNPQGNVCKKPAAHRNSTVASQQKSHANRTKRQRVFGPVHKQHRQEELTPVTLDCPYCSSQWKTVENLQFHIRAMHEKNKVQCHLCAQMFTRQTALNSHLNIVHRENAYNDPDYVPGV